MPFALLLAMQAGGMVIDYFGTQNQAELMEWGMNLQQEKIERNIQLLKIQTADESTKAMQDLRKNLGTQIAVNAARGTQSGAGSAFSLFTESIGNFNSDERMRTINAMGAERNLRTESAMSRLKYESDVSQLWQGFASRSINRFPTSLGGGQGLGQGFGLSSIGGK